MRILRAADHKRMPWKNGGGETTEIAVFPDNSGLGDFDWRVSMARVDGDGPFSSFSGIDRTLAILEGAGIILDVEGNELKRLTLESEPHGFPADVTTSARLIDGTVIDFNIMSRRGVVTHDVRCLWEKVSLPAGVTRLVLCSKGSFELAMDSRMVALARQDAALLDPADAVMLTPAPDSEYYLVEFRPA